MGFFTRKKQEFFESFQGKKEENLELPKNAYVNLIKDFDEKLNSIQGQISHMKLILFEMSEGKYNPFSEVADKPLNIDLKVAAGQSAAEAEAVPAKQPKEQEEVEVFQNTDGLLGETDRVNDDEFGADNDLGSITKILETENVLDVLDEKESKLKTELDSFLLDFGTKVNKSIFGKKKGKKDKHKIEPIVPSGKEFLFPNGKAAKNLYELFNCINESGEEVFMQHNENNDYANWVEHVLHIKKLADSLRSLNTKEETLAEIKRFIK